ncbi:MAG: SDR family NAD(P)-dependent oxidoreductase [Steroidobacteraceae bacterium]
MKICELFKVEGYGVVVTGGASGLGLGFAEALGSNGARITILDADAGRIASETGRLRHAGQEVRGAVVDVRDHAELDRAIDEAASAYGRLDVVFANAGIDSGPGFLEGWVGSDRPRNPQGALECYTDARWNKVIDVNLNGVFATLRAAARHMRPRKWGRIIVTTSLAALKAEPVVGAAYMAAKAGAAHLMRNVALELAADNITVNAIAPGFFVTNIGGGHAHDPELQRAVARSVPMHRVGLPSDIAGLALFLASPASGYVTGQQIVIDGGWGLGEVD